MLKRLNNKDVKKIIKEDLLDYMSFEDIKINIDSLKKHDRNVYSNYQAAIKMVEGGCFQVYFASINEYFKNLGVAYEYNNNHNWNRYKNMVATNIIEMLNTTN